MALANTGGTARARSASTTLPAQKSGRGGAENVKAPANAEAHWKPSTWPGFVVIPLQAQEGQYRDNFAHSLTVVNPPDNLNVEEWCDQASSLALWKVLLRFDRTR